MTLLTHKQSLGVRAAGSSHPKCWFGVSETQLVDEKDMVPLEVGTVGAENSPFSAPSSCPWRPGAGWWDPRLRARQGHRAKSRWATAAVHGLDL